MTADVASRHRRVALLGYIEELNERVTGPSVLSTQFIVSTTEEQILV